MSETADEKKYRIARGKRIRSYGLQVNEFNAMMRDQDGKCYICGGDNGHIALSIDHDHKTGRVRGLLCNKCNRALGLFNDNLETLLKAVDYLRNGVIPIKYHYPTLTLVIDNCGVLHIPHSEIIGDATHEPI